MKLADVIAIFPSEYMEYLFKWKNVRTSIHSSILYHGNECTVLVSTRRFVLKHLTIRHIMFRHLHGWKHISEVRCVCVCLCLNDSHWGRWLQRCGCRWTLISVVCLCSLWDRPASRCCCYHYSCCSADGTPTWSQFDWQSLRMSERLRVLVDCWWVLMSGIGGRPSHHRHCHYDGEICRERFDRALMRSMHRWTLWLTKLGNFVSLYWIYFSIECVHVWGEC